MHHFKRSLMVGALAAAMMFTGCTPHQSEARATSSGSLALSTDDSTLYAVDTDNGVVTAIDTKSDSVKYAVKVGDRPARVVVGSDDTLYVTNRGDNTISVIRKGEQTVSRTLNVGTEPVGIAVSDDNKTLYVVNATSADSADFGTLTGIDVATLQPTFELQVGAEPRGLVLLGKDTAAVTLYKEGELVEVDLKAKKVVSNKSGIYAAANLTRVNAGSTPGYSSFSPRAMGDVVATPDGTRLFAPVVWAREDSIGRTPTAGGYYAAGGPCNVSAVATPGIVTVDVGAAGSNGNGGSLQPQVDDLTACQSTGLTPVNKDFPISTLASAPSNPYGTSPSTPTQIQGTVATAVDATGNFVYLVNKESSNVAILPAYRRQGTDLVNASGNGNSVLATVNIGAGADGIALTRDGNRAYVYSQFEHRVELITQQVVNDKVTFVNTRQIPVGVGETLSTDEVVGRKLFYNAVDSRLSGPSTVVSCATCHLEGLEDGHTWSFPDGPRQTPALAGRKVLATAPYHWSGEFKTLPEFMTHTITKRMGGTGLDDVSSAQLGKFIDAMPAPKNANRKGQLTTSQLHGQQLFNGAAQCATCHAGSVFTDNSDRNVGSLVLASNNGRTPDNGLVISQGLNVPSLLGIARTAPYLHDGSIASLSERLQKNPGDKHGVTSSLSQADLADLVSYLKTL